MKHFYLIPYSIPWHLFLMSNDLSRFLIICSFFLIGKLGAVSSPLDSLKKGTLTIGGGIDAYYGYCFNDVYSGNMPLYVSMARQNEFNLNLAYLDVKYESDRVRFRFIPGIGTYMNANYAAEPGLLKVPVEANAGVQLSTKKEIWLEAGVFSSPYTNETPISKDHLVYSRSLAPEYVPYYVTGVKTTIPLSSRLKLYAYLINGWQQSMDLNERKSIGTSLEFKINSKTSFYWNTYTGDERSVFRPEFRTRFFNDVYVTFLQDKKFSFTSCAYFGVQEIAKSTPGRDYFPWWQVNFMGKYTFKNGHGLSGRIEYYDDPHSVQIASPSGLSGFQCFGQSICYNIPVQEHALLRFEAKHLYATNGNSFLSSDGELTRSMPVLYANLTVWF